MSIEIESPYFTGEDTEVKSTDPLAEQFYRESTIVQLKKMFPDKTSHMKTLMRLYEFCFSKKNITTPVIEKTEGDVLDDITKSPISLDISAMIQEQTDSIKKFYIEEQLFSKRVSGIPMFIDFAYLYYAWCYDKEAPIHKLPMSILKFNMISDALCAPDDDLNAAFAQCIENHFIRDLRIEKPPFMIRTDLNNEEIRDKIELLVKPVCKEILNGLFALDKTNHRRIQDVRQ